MHTDALPSQLRAARYFCFDNANDAEMTRVGECWREKKYQRKKQLRWLIAYAGTFVVKKHRVVCNPTVEIAQWSARQIPQHASRHRHIRWKNDILPISDFSYVVDVASEKRWITLVINWVELTLKRILMIWKLGKWKRHRARNQQKYELRTEVVSRGNSKIFRQLLANILPLTVDGGSKRLYRE